MFLRMFPISVLYNLYIFNIWSHCIELTKEPKQTVQRIYEAFRFDSFQADSCSSFPKKLEIECNEIKSYKRNQYNHLIIDDKMNITIRERWKRQLGELGYDKK
jgi:hypothetical protein